MLFRRSYSPALLKCGYLLLLALLMLPAVAFGQGASASGQTNVNVNVPEMLILHYFNKVNISLSAADLTGLIGSELPTGDEGEKSGSGFTANLAISPTDYSGQFTAALLTLQNAWAVRAINRSGSATTTLTIEVSADQLSHATSTSAVIDITDGKVADGTSSAASIDFAAPGFSNPTKGDVLLTLDLSNATEAGDYSGATFTLTATNY